MSLDCGKFLKCPFHFSLGTGTRSAGIRQRKQQVPWDKAVAPRARKTWECLGL